MSLGSVVGSRGVYRDLGLLLLSVRFKLTTDLDIRSQKYVKIIRWPVQVLRKIIMPSELLRERLLRVSRGFFLIIVRSRSTENY